MEDQPTGDVEIPDDILDQAVNESWDADEPPTEAPDAAAPEPVHTDDTPAPDATDTAPAGNALPEPAPAAHPAPEAASVPAAPANGKPFQFNASGSVQTLAGAIELPDGGVAIPKEAVADFRRELAHGRELQANFTKYRREKDREIQQAKTQRTQKDTEAEAVTSLMTELLRLTPDQQYAYLQQLNGNIPQLQHDLRERQLAEREKLLEEQRRGPQLSPEEQQERVTELATNDLNAEWQRLTTEPQFKDALSVLSEADRQAVYTRWAKKAHRLVRGATAEEAKQLGGNPGDAIFDPSELHEDLNWVITLKRQQAPPKPQAPSAAAQRNAALNADKQPTVNRIPPAPRNVVPSGPPRDKNGQFAKGDEGRKAFRKDFMADDDEAA